MIYIFLSLFKASEEQSELKEPRKYAELHAKMEKMYFEKSAQCGSASKELQFRGRALLSHVGYKSLVNTNSSSILERSFSDAVRAIADRRTKLRNVLKKKISLWFLLLYTV